MQVIPAIDIIDGRCVRLVQGDYDRKTEYGDPREQAVRFAESGAEIIHIVDLDGAKAGRPVNFDLVTAISDSVECEIEVGGGVRTEEDIVRYLEAGVERIIIGTRALSMEFLPVIRKYARYIIGGIDAKDGMVATHGWIETSELSAVALIERLREAGVETFIFTDIATDGMLSGPNIPVLADILVRAPGISLISSGGVSSIGDIIALKSLERAGLTGCIVGKAIYDGRVNTADAIRAGK